MCAQAVLAIPSTPDAIERPRLIARLRGFEDYKVSVISAPAGAGKTTLAAQFVRQVAAPWEVAWLTLLRRDRDLNTLYEDCLQSLEGVAPAIRELPAPYGRPPVELAVLITEHLRTLDSSILYLLDDVHAISGAAKAEQWLHQFVELLPPNCRVILISRALPPIDYINLLSRNHVNAFRQNELNFTEDEVASLFERLPEEDAARAQAIATRLEGWAAGVALAARATDISYHAMLGSDEAPETLFKALAGDALAAQPLDLQDFLLASSTLTRMTPALCADTLGASGPSDMLARIQANNLFIYETDEGLVYHALFREFLQEELAARSPERYANLHRRAGQWFEERDDAEAALEHYLAASLVDSARMLANRIAPTHFAQGKFETLLDLAGELLRSDILAPRLLTFCAMIFTDRYEYESAERYLDLAEQAIAAGHGHTHITDVHLQRAFVAIQVGQCDRAEVLIQEALQFPPDHPGNFRGRALRIQGLAHLRRGNIPESIGCLEEALPLYRARGQMSDLSHLLEDLILAHTRAGSFDQAGGHLLEAVGYRRQLGSAIALASILNDLGYYYHQRGNYREAGSVFEEAQSLLARVPDRRTESYLLWSLGDLRRDQGASDEAEQHYYQALGILHLYDNPSLHSAILTNLSTLLRWQGRSDDALQRALEALEIAEQKKLAYEAALARAASLASLAELGESASALTELEDVVADLERQGARYEVLGVLAIHALTCVLGGDSEQALVCIHRAASWAKELGVWHPLVAEIAHSERLHALTVEDEAFASLRRDLARLLESADAREHLQVIPRETDDLQVFTLGQEDVVCDAKHLSISDWEVTAARDLFFFLLFEGPCTRDDILTVFWPEGNPSQSNTLRTMHYRARQALGEDTIRREDDLVFINPNVRIWCDATAFEIFVRQALTLPAHDARSEYLWHQAVRLYKGSFLPSIDAEWANFRRDSLHAKYLQALLGLGQCAMAGQDIDKALELFRTATDMEPYREEFHRAIMRCYARLGEQQQVAQYYEELQQLFHDDLGLAPSPETTALKKRLLQ